MPENASESLLVVSAHAGDFVWRAGGAIALAAARGGTTPRRSRARGRRFGGVHIRRGRREAMWGDE